MNRIRVGRINYINTYPLFYTILKEKNILPFDIVSDIPTALNSMMREGDLDVSLISSSEYATTSANHLIYSDYCLASTGYVNSVLLIAKKDIENLQDARIGLSTSSATSGNLIKIILKEFYGFDNTFISVPCGEDFGRSLSANDALLIIGDEALRFKNNGTYKIYDIGQLWMERTGFPVVFAIIAVNAQSIRTHKDTVEMLFNKFHESHAHYKKRPEDIAELAQSDSMLSLNFTDYFANLNYIFSDELKRGLLYYYSMLAKCGLGHNVEQLRFY
jgi:chorismate dehydratase